MLLKILQTGEACLRQPTISVPPAKLRSAEIQRLIDLMIATLRDNPGVGLAAPQVGESWQIIVVEDTKQYQAKVTSELLTAQKRRPVPLKVIVNPILIINDPTMNLLFEGCLSINGYRAVVPRADRVTISGLDRHGKAVSMAAEGWFARILEHEIDHLHGKLYVDRMHSETFMAEAYFQDQWAGALPAQISTLIDAGQTIR